MVIDIKKGDTYDLSRVARERLLWGQKDVRKVRELVNKDREGRNILNAEMVGEGLGTRYQIKGANIIKFLEVYSPGVELATTWQRKK